MSQNTPRSIQGKTIDLRILTRQLQECEISMGEFEATVRAGLLAEMPGKKDTLDRSDGHPRPYYITENIGYNQARKEIMQIIEGYFGNNKEGGKT